MQVLTVGKHALWDGAELICPRTLQTRNQEVSKAMVIPRRTLGRTGYEATIMGLGGEGILRTYGYETQAYELINRAVDLGINYFESARAYSGSEAYYGLALKERRGQIFLTSKSHARDKRGALGHLRQTLTDMKTDYLDLWQIHDVRTNEDIEEIFGPGGAIHAFSEAKKQSMTRFIGVTGHHDPFITKRCMEIFDFDTVLVPVNPAEPIYKSYLQHVVPAAAKKGMGIIAMKVYFRGFASKLPFYTSMEPFFRFALSQPITLAVIGCDDIAQLEQNVEFAATFKVMGEDETQDLIDEVYPYGRKLMYYKP
jgi:aryl-alcohol dehydrogenase-like predicted oxidoreductase